MAVLYKQIKFPTPGQSQIVDFTERTIDGSAYDLYARPGYIQQIPHVYKLLSATFYLVASAVVANRTITLLIRRVDKGSGTHHQIIQAVTGNITASQSGIVVASTLGTLDGLTNTGINVIASLQIGDLYISGHDYIACAIGNGQAGDLYNVGLQLEYQNHIKGITEA